MPHDIKMKKKKSIFLKKDRIVIIIKYCSCYE